MEETLDCRLQKMAARLKLTYTRDHLSELVDNVDRSKMSPREMLDYIFGKEIEKREANHYKQALMAAHFPAIKKLKDFDLTFQPSINPGIIRELSKMEWVETGRNLAFFGPPGVGKTHLAIAYGCLALEHGYSVRFYPAPLLLALLEKAQKEGVFDEKLREINKPKVIIIDEIGYLPYNHNLAHLFFHFISKRYEKKSIIVTSNRAPSEWRLVFSDQQVSDAITDRLFHHCSLIVISGDSYRLHQQEMQNQNIQVQ